MDYTYTFRDSSEFNVVICDQDLNLDELDKIWWHLEHTRFRHQVEPDPHLGETLEYIFSQIDSLSLSSDDIKFYQHCVEEAYRSHPDFEEEDDEEDLLAFQEHMKAVSQKLSSNTNATKKKSSKKAFWDL